MRALASYLVLLLAMPLAALAVVSPANVYRAQGIAAPDCDGPLQVLIFARRFHRLVSVLCLIIALATVPNIAEAVHELYRNAADGECLG
ncbi:hypothetical protein HF259_05075 [Rhizobium leguminosarum]|uniref:hypothetical protein n=1 Tax=Rhizobium leguminosarum TaxID=384 RepID=UPI001C920EDE|nr:hypothetical protein [Rhizobium leguminosarum]MBY2920814.1 hypothetical protein [Rhizobium leguminosarum]